MHARNVMKQDKVVKSVVLEAENFLFRTVTGKCNFYSGVAFVLCEFCIKGIQVLHKVVLTEKQNQSLYAKGIQQD